MIHGCSQNSEFKLWDDTNLFMTSNAKLTHLPLEKIATISQTIYSYAFCTEKFCTLIEISLKFVHKGPIDNKPALV